MMRTGGRTSRPSLGNVGEEPFCFPVTRDDQLRQPPQSLYLRALGRLSTWPFFFLFIKVSCSKLLMIRK